MSHLLLYKCVRYFSKKTVMDVLNDALNQVSAFADVQRVAFNTYCASYEAWQV